MSDAPWQIRGAGWWVAFHAAIDPGGQGADVSRALLVCESTGADWICLRAGAGGLNDAALAPSGAEPNLDILRAYKAAGLKVVVWIFSYAHTWHAEVEAFRRLVATGLVDAVMINAEYDWEAKGTFEDATAFITALRAALPTGFHIGHAPPDYLGGRGGDNHKGHSCWDAFDALCDSIHPQCYAYEHSDRGHRLCIDEVSGLYLKRGLIAKVCPVLCSYRPTSRGYDSKGHPLATPPMVDEAVKVAADVIDGLSDMRVIAAPAASIYTIDALNFIKRSVGDVVLAALQARWAERRPIAHEGPSPFESAATLLRAGEGEHTPKDWLDEDGVDQNEIPTTPGTPTSKSGNHALDIPKTST